MKSTGNNFDNDFSLSIVSFPNFQEKLGRGGQPLRIDCSPTLVCECPQI